MTTPRRVLSSLCGCLRHLLPTCQTGPCDLVDTCQVSCSGSALCGSAAASAGVRMSLSEPGEMGDSQSDSQSTFQDSADLDGTF